MAQALVQVEHLVKHFPVGTPLALWGGARAVVHAVDDVSFAIEEGRTLGLVGESGCGKTTLSRMILKLLPPTSGEILFKGLPLTTMDRRQERFFRTSVQAVFQDPYSSLNPRMRVRDIILEPARALSSLSRAEADRRLAQLLEAVGLPAIAGGLFPHEFSGGQRQRIAIARALSVDPQLLLLDEPVSALDVSIRAQVINLLLELQSRLGLTYLMIAHDLAVVYHASDDIGVMYLGKIVEIAPSDELVDNPLHPYTKLLLSAVPVPDPSVQSVAIQRDTELPSPVHPPTGCRFNTRCPYAEARCFVEEPEMREVTPGHKVACHLY